MAQRLMAAALLLMAAPLLVVLAVLVRLDGGPVLFRQTRLGVGRRPFTIHKLRTMREGQVTRIGRFLRGTGLDELPQLADIALGRMRFIGPRPLTEADVMRLEWGSPAYDGRWLVAPGLTGFAQLAPVCDRAVSWSLDDFYARHRSARLDLRITAASCLALVAGKERAKGWFWA